MSVAYQPDLLYWEGKLRSGMSLWVDAAGAVCAPTEVTVSRVRMPGKALFPGLVNAHSHAFQRLLRGRTEHVAKGEDFWSWREQMYRAAQALGPEELYVASRQAFVEMALAGITCVGEFHYLHHGASGEPYADKNELAGQVIRAAREVGLRIALLRVAYGRAGFGVPDNPGQRRFIDRDVGAALAAVQELASAQRRDSRVTVGLAPHSVRAVPKAWLSAVRQYPGVVHMHVAEQRAEVEACQAEHGRRPVELLADLELLGPRFTAVHAVHLSPQEVALLAQTTVCACPSTERNLGDGVLPADSLVKAGAHLALGSDSQATIDLLDEARQLEGHLRLVRERRGILDPQEDLFRAATVGGARSLGLDTGELAVGRPADFFTVDLHHPALAGADAATALPSLVFGGDARAIRDVAVAGELIVRDGQHPFAEESGRAFSALSGRVFS